MSTATFHRQPEGRIQGPMSETWRGTEVCAARIQGHLPWRALLGKEEEVVRAAGTLSTLHRKRNRSNMTLMGSSHNCNILGQQPVQDSIFSMKERPQTLSEGRRTLPCHSFPAQLQGLPYPFSKIWTVALSLLKWGRKTPLDHLILPSDVGQSSVSWLRQPDMVEERKGAQG